MNVLITGGTGYIGYALVKHLLENTPESVNLTVYDNLSRGNYNFFFHLPPTNRVRFIRGELLDSRLLNKEVELADVVYHSAAKVTTPFADQDSHMFEQVNHWGTSELVQAVERHPVEKFVYLSSMSVYGRVEEQTNESSPLHPESFYGFSKQRAEAHVARLFDQKIDTYIIRSGNVYGYNPSLRFDAVINKFMFDAHTRGRIKIQGSGEQHRAFIHVNKIAYALGSLLEGKIPSGIYNLAEHNLSVNYIANTISELYPNLERLYINQHLQMREIQAELPVKLSQHINWPDVTFADELKQFKEAFRV